MDTEMLHRLVGKDHAAKLLMIRDRLPQERRDYWLANLLRSLTTTDADIAKMVRLKFTPVPPQEFLESKYYLGKKGEIYPKVMEEIVRMSSGQYDEVTLTGGIGSGKTTIALYLQAVELYRLSAYHDPHAVLGQDSSSEIKVIFQSLNAKLSKGVDFNRFHSMLSGSPYFQNHFPFNTDIKSCMKFPNRVEVEPVSGSETAAIGQNVIGGIIDEINFMSVVEKSKQAPDGEVYDQAVQLYNSIARRRKSRFMKAGQKLPGLLCLVSSKRVPGQFTDRKEEEAKTNPRIYVYDKRVWDIKPPGSYVGEVFDVFVGDGSRQPRVLLPGERETLPERDRRPVSEGGLIDEIPIEYRQEFADDITKALRDIAGRSTLAIHPFMPRREDVLRCFGQSTNVFAEDRLDLSRSKAKIRVAEIKNGKRHPRWAHLDLGLTSDSAGVVIGHVPQFRLVERDSFFEMLPEIVIDGVLEVVPPSGHKGEIDFAGIRRILYKLRDLGLPLRWVTMDSFASEDTMQILRQQGFVTGHQSMDTTNLPYDILKQALYDGRVIAPKCKKLEHELVTLERDFRKGKIDHAPKGSKDLADSLAGVCFGLTMRREIWNQHKVPISQAVSVSSMMRDEEHERGQK